MLFLHLVRGSIVFLLHVIYDNQHENDVSTHKESSSKVLSVIAYSNQPCGRKQTRTMLVCKIYQLYEYEDFFFFTFSHECDDLYFH